MTKMSSPPALAAAVLLLDRASVQCVARGNGATSVQDDLTIWHLDALTVSVAAATLREATTAALPQLLDLDPVPAGGDPLELVLAARDELETVPDELDNLPLFLGRLRMHDAVAAVRTHYERTAEPETGAEPAAAGASAR